MPAVANPQRGALQALREVPPFLKHVLIDEAGITAAVAGETNHAALVTLLKLDNQSTVERAQAHKIGALVAVAHRGTKDDQTLELVFDAAQWGLPGFCSSKEVIAAGFYALGRIVPALDLTHPVREKTNRLIDLYAQKERGIDGCDCLAAKWAGEQISPTPLDAGRLPKRPSSRAAK